MEEDVSDTRDEEFVEDLANAILSDTFGEFLDDRRVDVDQYFAAQDVDHESQVFLDALSSFKDLWKLQTGTDVPSNVHVELTIQEVYFAALDDRLADLVAAYVTYYPELEAAKNGIYVRNNEKVALFLGSAFIHGYIGDSGPETLSIAAGFLRGSISEDYADDCSDPTNWLLFMVWYQLGMHTALFSLAEKESRVIRSSKQLTIEEFDSGVPFEDVTAKPTEKAFCIFVSHRWLTKGHPDPERMEKVWLLPLFHRTQKLVDFLNSPTENELSAISRDYSDVTTATAEGKDSLASVAAVARSTELFWATFFFARGQKHVLVWYDFQSVPQGRDLPSRKLRKKCLDEIELVCQTMPVLAIPTCDYFSRAWCVFECIQCIIGERPLLRFASGAGEVSQGIRENWVLRVEWIYGRFCALMEQGDNAGMVLEQVGLQCTNGADLAFLSEALESQSKAGHRCDYLVKIHPLETAHRIFLNDIIDDNDRSEECYPLLRLLSKLRVSVRLGESDTPHRDGIHEYEDAVSFRWRHPQVGMEYLVRTREVWDIPSFFDDVEKLLQMIRSIGAFHGHEPKSCDSECDRLKISLEDAVKQAPWRTVLICFGA